MSRTRPRPVAVCASLLVLLAACAGGSSAEPAPSSPPPSTAPEATVALGTLDAPPTVATTAAATTSTSTSTTTTTTTTTLPPTTTIPDLVQTRELGRSVEGRPITAIERGTPGGTPILIIGVIHGNEAAGTAIVEDLLTLPVPDGVDLWLVPSMNPDGQREDRRTNANLVDLNRNFPHQWAPLGEPGDGQYAGTGPASEPETQAIVALVEELDPALLIWYHQDLNRIAPASGRAGEIRARYADLTGLPMETITGGTYTGTAAGWARRALPDGVAFIVELGPTLSAAEALRHASAVLTIAEELRPEG